MKLEFHRDASRIARCRRVNERTENIGARRLHTVMETLLEEVSFAAPHMEGVTLAVDGDYVRRTLQDIVEDQDLSRYVL